MLKISLSVLCVAKSYSVVQANIKRVSKDECACVHAASVPHRTFLMFPDRTQRVYGAQKAAALEKCEKWSAIWKCLRMSGQDQTNGFLQGGCKELFMFGVNPDPKAVVSKVWEIYLDDESRKTQLYADAHVKVVVTCLLCALTFSK